MVITVFGDTVVKPGKEKAEDKLVEKLDPILRAMPGFISIKAYRGEDGEEIGIARPSRRAYMHDSGPDLTIPGKAHVTPGEHLRTARHQNDGEHGSLEAHRVGLVGE